MIMIKINATILSRIVMFVAAAMMLSFYLPANSPKLRFTQVTDRSVENRRALRSQNRSERFARGAFGSPDAPHYSNMSLQRTIDPAAPKHFAQTNNPYNDKSMSDHPAANTAIAVKHAVSRHHMIQFNVDSGGGKRLELILQWIRAQKVDLT